jgi:ribonuclease T1
MSGPMTGNPTIAPRPGPRASSVDGVASGRARGPRWSTPARVALVMVGAFALWLGLSLLLPGAAFARDPSGAPASEIAVDRLPAEARAALALIRAGGPFPYDKDGTVFGNREGLLPRQARGYYREYTVKTPGSRDRGARRIVAGGDAQRPADLWYTDDHYRSFRRIRE